MIRINPVYIPRLALIGVGLIGGSLLKALKSENAVGEVIGVGRGVENLQLAVSMGVIDRYTHDVVEAVKDADLVVIATPIGAFEPILKQIFPHLKKDAIVSDVGSAKGEIIRAVKRVMGDQSSNFVPAHPIAGAEHSGVKAAMQNLFVDHNVIVTPLPETNPESRTIVEQMWRLTGARIVEMEVDLHDQILGVTSHLPHVVVFALMDYLSRQKLQGLQYQFAAGGLYDLTRIASSDARMWSDICLNNKDKLLPIMREYATELMNMADQIEADEGDKLIDKFEHAKLARSRVADYRK